MKLYPGQARTIARQLFDELIKLELVDIVSEMRDEAERDVDAVIMQYIRTERDINTEARDTIHARGLGNNAFGRIKRRLAKERGFAVGDDALDWLVNQIIEMLLYSNNIEEVYAEDRELRRITNKIIKGHTNIESELQREAKKKIKNLEEGSNAWDVEYAKALDNLKRRKGLVK